LSHLKILNYQPGLKLQGDDEFILGRNASTIHPQGLSIDAFYDYDSALLGTGPAGYTDPNANWMNESTPPTTTDAYFTEPISFIDPSNVDIRKYPADYGNPAGFSGVAYRRSKLDGISVDFNPNDYQQIVQNAEVSTIAQFNGTDLSGTFEFNAVLVYYNVVDSSDSTKNATNLYGILLLDNITPTTDGGYIQRYPKYKPNKITGQNGNSYGFKMNLRFDASPGTTGIDTIINDYNTFSMGLFSDATAQLQESAKIFQRQQLEISELEQRVQGLENSIAAVSSSAFLQAQIDAQQVQLNQANLAFADGATLLDLIAKNADEIQGLANGDVSLSLQYNTGVLRQGSGIIVDKTVPNQVTLSLGSQEYVIMSSFDLNDIEINAANPLNMNVAQPQATMELLPFTNMLRLETVNTAGGDLLLYIDDSDIQWKEGQTVRFAFTDGIDMGSRNIRIFTDAQNRMGGGAYGYQAAVISNAELSVNPLFELVCLEQGVLNFAYDIIK